MAAQHFLTQAEVLAWLLKPEHDRGNTAMTEPPLWKRGKAILAMAAGKGLLDPQLTEEGAVSRCTGARLRLPRDSPPAHSPPTPAGSDKGSVYQLSVGLADEDEVACHCTCPFASGPVRARVLLWSACQLVRPLLTALAAELACATWCV